MSELETREFAVEYRESDDTGYLEGIAVPWDETTTIGGVFDERFERGSVETEGTVWLYRDHKHPIGELIESEDRDEGFWVRAKVALSDLAIETRDLLREGVLRALSIGFVPVTSRDESGVVVRTKVRLREVSVVARPAYAGATITNVRSETSAADSTPTERKSEVTDTATAAEVIELRGAIEELDRTVQTLASREPEAVVADTRSAGEILKAIASGDEATIRSYETALENRAYTGGTSADAVVKPQGLVDLVRIFDASSGVLADVFSTGVLPATGNSLEFVEVSANTIAVNEQAAEGDDISFGKVTLTTRTAPVKTYAGGTELTRQSIERSTVGVLNTSLEALATAAGARKKAALRTAYNTLVAARTAVAANGGVVVLGATLAAGTAGNWEDALVDAALKFELQNLVPEVLIVSGTVFKKLRSLTVSGERVMRVGEKNESGTLDLPGLKGDFAGIPVRLDSGQAGDSAVFANGRAIRQYDSSLVSLTDENIVNLSKAFAVYRYGAVAEEIPAGVVPVKLAAS